MGIYKKLEFDCRSISFVTSYIGNNVIIRDSMGNSQTLNREQANTVYSYYQKYQLGKTNHHLIHIMVNDDYGISGYGAIGGVYPESNWNKLVQGPIGISGHPGLTGIQIKNKKLLLL